MLALNFIEFMFFVGIPGVIIFFIIFGVWIERSSSNTAVKLRQQTSDPVHTTNGVKHRLKSEMHEYYANENFDRRVGRR
jgi:hypothetical protein